MFLIIMHKSLFKKLCMFFLVFLFLNSSVMGLVAVKKNYVNESNDFDLVIIAPSEFSDSLSSLVDHKNNINVKTNLVFTESIYNFFDGRDKAEQIKYFIKYAIEEWNISYILLVGDVDKIPTRKTYSSIWPEEQEYILSDHYYADIYNETDDFCSWDSNENNKFGEIEFLNDTNSMYVPKCKNCWKIVLNVSDIDGVDLYPDVAVGRLPCSNRKEVDIVVNKIIKYENTVYGQPWFKKIVLAGGDTHPEFEGLEGEILAIKTAEILSDFKHVFLFTSKNNLNAFSFNRAINRGCGFVSYDGHGYEYGWGTYKPNSSTGDKMIKYNSPRIKFLFNRNKVPIIFFNACLTSKLDFELEDLYQYKSMGFLKLLTLLPGVNNNTRLPCFAWNFIKKRNGGAIATVGSTSIAYSLIFDDQCSYAGFGFLNIHFFKAYNESAILGDMFMQSQIDYLDEVIHDYMTLEQYILLGDPTLRVGGYQI